jgi:hypothetical protein
MATVSDAFTIGMILLLIFGAISFYLYTRIQQGEKRLSLCENILLDMKVSSEQGMHLTNLDFMSAPEMGQTDMYESAIDAAYSPEEPIDDVMVEKVDEDMISTLHQTTSQEQEEEQEEEIDLSLYDGLTVKELKNLAKNNHISGASSMSRTQLIDALTKAKIVPSIVNEIVPSGAPVDENGAVSFD